MDLPNHHSPSIRGLPWHGWSLGEEHCGGSSVPWTTPCPPGQLTAPPGAPQPLPMALVEEEEKHQEQCGGEPTLSYGGAGGGSAKGPSAAFGYDRVPFTAGLAGAQLGPALPRPQVPHTWCLHHHHLCHNLSQAQWCMNCPDNAPGEHPSATTVTGLGTACTFFFPGL